MTGVTTMSTKGQVILPKSVRDERQWDTGTLLIVEQTDAGVLLRAREDAFVPTTVAAVFGSLGGAGDAKSIEQMNAGIADEARRRHARGRH